MSDEIIDQGRRTFFKETFSYFGNAVSEIVKNKVEAVTKNSSGLSLHAKKRRYIRPPGAVREEEFIALCTKCDECIKVCPHESIRKLNKDFDIADGTPIIVPEETPCYLCEDYHCIKACNDGALVAVNKVEEITMGHASINEDNCMAYGAQFCEQCVRNCPVPDAIYLEDNKPVVRREKCVGCGICENVCNTVNQPIAIKVVP
ncbi:ferredoxin [Candidatus Scalindua japonica]|uniref:Ferredoxin n=1 Tax=Candidatus Scalindua japonica TaxID=1284222 RepID=A0A286TU92_9BACT|nr:4Fe-4S dicluster domain-containing protein [Candidatus Scalindua japonica]GAX59462.1 ferredoxin [Candidatus Scalindua japonica]